MATEGWGEVRGQMDVRLRGEVVRGRRTGQVKSGHIKSSQVRSGQVKSGHIKSSPFKSSGQMDAALEREGPWEIGHIPLTGGASDLAIARLMGTREP